MKLRRDHPVIEDMERYGYVREPLEPEYDEDAAFEERRERELVGE